MMQEDKRLTVGIRSIAMYLPEQRMTSAEISALSGVPQTVVETKLGIIEKPIPGPDDHPCEMGIRAAKLAIERVGIDPLDIDVVIYIGEEYKEYPVWTAALKLQEEIGARNAWGFDAALRCGTTIMAMKLAKHLLQGDDRIRHVLLAGGYRNGDLIDYSNPRTRFMFNLGAGGGAILLQKGAATNIVLETSLKTDGAFSEDVIVCAGGTKQPVTAEILATGGLYFNVPDPEGMKRRLEEKSMANFLEVVRTSVRDSGYQVEDIDFIGILHMKKSAHDYVLEQLNLTPEQTVYLDHYGHIGQFDPILCLELGIAEGKIRSGSVVVLVAAGIGYAWGAVTIKWGDEAWN